MKTQVILTMNDQHRLKVVNDYEAGKLHGQQGASILHLSLRQFRRVVAAYRKDGVAGLIHGNRERTPTNRLAESVREEILRLAEACYADYNDCHFAESLAERPEPIEVSRSTVRRLRRAAGQGSPRKRRAPRHRRRRERSAQAGMLVQTDASRHDWLEGRGPWLSLVAMIDDATNQVLAACFREQEDAAGYFLALQEVCLRHGLPQAIYADRHTIFQSSAKPSLEEELYGELKRTQFGRLLDELGIVLIAARSPQAKGRIERLWGTFQDRLVKELRQAGACDLESANRLLETYLPRFNARFQVEAARPGSAFGPCPTRRQLADCFCFKYSRKVTNDNTIPFDSLRLQIPPGLPRRSYAKTRVELRHTLDGSLAIFHDGLHLITFQPAAAGPPRVGHFQPASQPPSTRPSEPAPLDVPKAPRTPRPPAPDHPWRNYAVRRVSK